MSQHTQGVRHGIHVRCEDTALMCSLPSLSYSGSLLLAIDGLRRYQQVELASWPDLWVASVRNAHAAEHCVVFRRARRGDREKAVTSQHCCLGPFL